MEIKSYATKRSEGANMSDDIVTPSKVLTDQQRLFLFHLLDGKTAESAYTSANYPDSPQKAYELKDYLKEDYNRIASIALTEADIAVHLANMLKLPCNATTLTIKDKIEVLKLMSHFISGKIPVDTLLEKLVINRYHEKA